MILFKNLKKLTNQRGKVKLWLLLFAFLLSGQLALAQIIIKGTITEPNGAPLPGATIMIKGTSIGTVSDIEGKYSIPAKVNDILVISSIGYETKEISVTQGASTIDVAMETDLLKLDEVVVIGYGTQRKGDLTAAITSVKSDEFISGSVKDAGQLIQGKVAGLNITTPDGDPAGNTQITLRGQVSINANSDVLVIIDGIPGGDLKTVAPQDIADITVLKDGSSAAIYGARGNNGVIIITTKRGMKNQPLSVDYSTYVSTETISKKLSILTADDFYRMANDTLPGGSNIYRKIQIEPDGTTTTDWLSEITRTPVSQMHNLTIRGGGEKSGYIANFNYNNAQGIFIKSQVENLKARFDINQSMLSDKLTFNLGILSGLTNNPSVYPGLAYRNTITRNPTDRVKDETGIWQERPGFQYYNPVSMLNEEISNSRSRYNWMHGTITLNPIHGLFMKLLLDRNVWNSNWGDYLTKKHYESVINAQNAIAQLEAQTSIDDLLEYTMEYTKSINNVHTFNFMGGYSYSYNSWDRMYMMNKDFPSDIFTYNNIYLGDALRNKAADMQSAKNMQKLIAFFGRVNYNYKDRYLLQASLRREGSSKFGANNKWGNFPSLQLGWHLSNEAFMKSIGFISDLKLRLGYGVTGEVPNDAYMSLTLMNYSDNQYFYYNGKWLSSLVFNRNPNPDLRWERKREYDLGLDWAVLNSRISGTVDYYDRLTNDLLYSYNVPVPPNLAPTTYANVGSMSNKGWEVLLNGIPVKTSDFEWNTNITYSTNKNKLISLENETYQLSSPYLDGGYTGDPIQLSTHRIYPGQALGDIYGYKVVGYYAAGYIKNKGEDAYDTVAMWLIDRPRVIDENTGNVTQEADTVYYKSRKTSDIQKLGNGIPKFFLSWNNTFRYKKFDLSISMRGAFGFQILNFARMYFDIPNTKFQNTLSTSYKKYHTEITEDDIVKGGDYLLGESNALTSEYVENGDYWKIDNITLGYNFIPKNFKYIKSLRVYASCLNLYTITKYSGIDPEVTRNLWNAGDDDRDKYPTTRKFTVGLDVKF